MKSLILSGLSWLVIVGATPASDLFVSDAADRLWLVDADNWQASLLGDVGRPMKDLAYRNGDLFGISHPDDIWYIDWEKADDNGNIPVTRLASLGIADSSTTGQFFNYTEITALTTGPDGNLYFATAENIHFREGRFFAPTGHLYAITSLDPLLGGEVGDIGTGNGGGLAFVDRTLYMNSCRATGFFSTCSATQNEHLVRIDPPWGEGVTLGSIGANLTAMESIDGKLIGLTDAGQVMEIHAGTGAGTLLEVIGLRPIGAARKEQFGDYNGNGVVEQADLDLVLLNWGLASNLLPATWIRFRLEDGIVGQESLDAVLLPWGQKSWLARAGMGGQTAAIVPEPSTGILALICVIAGGAIFLWARRLKSSQED